MAQFRIKYSIYRVEAGSAHEAKEKLSRILKTSSEDWFSVEDASLFDERRPLWRRLLGG